MGTKKYYKPKMTVVHLVTKSSLRSVCRGAREIDPIGPCNNDPGADCESTGSASNNKCQFKGDFS